MVYEDGVMLPVEINTPIWHKENLSEEGKLFIFTDLVFFVDKKATNRTIMLLMITFTMSKVNETGLRCNLDMLEEIRDAVHIQEFTAKQRAVWRYNSTVVPIEGKWWRLQGLESCYLTRRDCTK